MSKVIEDTLKALNEFEAKLDSAKHESTEAKRQMLARANEWAEEAKAESLKEARRIANETISEARKEAETEAESIRSKGKTALVSLEESLSRRRAEAVDYVTKALLGEAK